MSDFVEFLCDGFVRDLNERRNFYIKSHKIVMSPIVESNVKVCEAMEKYFLEKSIELLIYDLFESLKDTLPFFSTGMEI